MKRLTSLELKEIKGGASITGSLLNAFVDILKVLLDAGRSVGSGIRRATSDSLCPTDL